MVMKKNHCVVASNVSSACINSFKDQLSGEEYKPLTKAKEHELFLDYKAGNLAAMHAIVKANLRYAMREAENYVRKFEHMDYEELVGNACRGLVEAVSRFDLERDVRFATFAGSYILKYIMDGIEKNYSYDSTFTSIDVKYYDEEEGEALSDHIACDMAEEECFNVDCASETILRVIDDSLGEREAFVIKHQFGIGCDKMKVQDIARVMSLSEESIRLLKNKALGVLRNSVKINELYEAC